MLSVRNVRTRVIAGSVVKFEVHPRAPPAAHQPFASHPGQAPAHQGSYAAAAAATPQYPKANASHKRGSHRASQQHHVPEQIRVHDHHSAVPAQQKTSNIDQAGWASFSPPESSRRPTSKPSPAARPSTPSNQKRSEPIGNDAIQQSPETVASLKAIQTVEKEVDALTSQVNLPPCFHRCIVLFIAATGVPDTAWQILVLGSLLRVLSLLEFSHFAKLPLSLFHCQFSLSGLARKVST